MHKISINAPDSFKGMLLPIIIPLWPQDSLPWTKEGIAQVARALSPYFLDEEKTQCFCWGLYDNQAPMILIHPTVTTSDTDWVYGVKIAVELGNRLIKLEPMEHEVRALLIEELNDWAKNDPKTGFPNYFADPKYKFYASRLVNGYLDGYYFG